MGNSNIVSDCLVIADNMGETGMLQFSELEKHSKDRMEIGNHAEAQNQGRAEVVDDILAASCTSFLHSGQEKRLKQSLTHGHRKQGQSCDEQCGKSLAFKS